MKKIVISNGFTNFPLRFVAEGLHKKGHDVVLLTGIYPFKKLITLFKILHIDKFGTIQRIINRKISIPDKKIQSFFISEIFYQIGRNLYNHFDSLKKIYKYIDFNAAKSYQLSSNKFLKNLPLNQKYIYLCRAGYGGDSLIRNKNFKVFVEHQNVHPKVFFSAIQKKGRITKNIKFKDKLDGLFIHIKNDLDSSKNLIILGEQSLYTNKLYFQKHLKNDKKLFFKGVARLAENYIKNLKKKKLVKKFAKNERLKVFYFGSFVERKGAEVLLDIMKNYNEKKIDLTIITNGFDFKYKKKIEKLRRKNIRFLINKKVDYIIETMIKNHVCIFPSYSEGLARTCIEALACGNYLVTSKIFTDFKNRNLGVSFVDQTNSKEWLKELYKLRKKPKILNKAFKKNQTQTIKLFSQEIFIKKYSNYFKI